jgi:hypothetical protein
VEHLETLLVLGVPISVVAPLVVQQAKNLGMRTEYTGLASMLVCLVLAILASAANGTLAVDHAATYFLQGIIYGLAGNGVYSQVRMLTTAGSVA